MSNEARDRMYQQLFGDGRMANSQAQSSPPPDRGATSLGTLDAHGLAELRRILLTVIDDGDRNDSCQNWRFYLGLDQKGGWVDQDKANAARLDFCDAVQAAIVKAAAPATVAKGDK